MTDNTEAKNFEDEIHKKYMRIWDDIEDITFKNLNIKIDEGYDDNKKYSNFFRVWNRLKDKSNFTKIENMKFFKKFVNMCVREKDFRIERFREMYIRKGYIAIRARLGGGNKEDYYYIYKILERHPLFLGYRNMCIDEGFDCTFCLFFFEFPYRIKKFLMKIDRLDKACLKTRSYEKKLEYVKKMNDVINEYKIKKGKNETQKIV